MDTGAASQEDLQRVIREVTSDVIREQTDAGIDLPTDGQIAWEDGQTPFAKGLKGFEITGLIRYFDTNTYYRQPVPSGKIEWTEAYLCPLVQICCWGEFPTCEGRNYRSVQHGCPLAAGVL